MRKWGHCDAEGHSYWWPAIARNKKSIAVEEFLTKLAGYGSVFFGYLVPALFNGTFGERVFFKKVDFAHSYVDFLTHTRVGMASVFTA